jgi:hypothetical protein
MILREFRCEILDDPETEIFSDSFHLGTKRRITEASMRRSLGYARCVRHISNARPSGESSLQLKAESPAEHTGP